MKITTNVNIVLVDTFKKPYRLKRKGYWRGKVYVKSKTLRRFRSLKLKNPYLHSEIALMVDEILQLNKNYVDNNGLVYKCVSTLNIFSPISNLKNVQLRLDKNIFRTPIELTLVK